VKDEVLLEFPFCCDLISIGLPFYKSEGNPRFDAEFSSLSCGSAFSRPFDLLYLSVKAPFSGCCYQPVNIIASAPWH
jgi:hypothetical protein